MSSIAFIALLVLASIPTAKPSGTYLPTSSLTLLDGECIPKESLKPSTTPFENFLICYLIQPCAFLIPFQIPSTMCFPISVILSGSSFIYLQ